MAGIWMCAFAGLCGLIGLALYLFPPADDTARSLVVRKLLGYGFWYGLAVLLIVASLEWGNIGVIYSHAGLTG